MSQIPAPAYTCFWAPGRSTTATTDYEVSESNFNQYNEYYDIDRIKLKITPGTPREASMVKGLEKTTKPYSNSKLPGRKSTTTTVGPDDDSLIGTPGRSTTATTDYEDSESNLNQYNEYYDIDKIRLNTTPRSPGFNYLIEEFEGSNVKPKWPKLKSTTSPSQTTVGPDDDSLIGAPGRSTTHSTDYELSSEDFESNLNQYNEYYDIDRIKLKPTPGSPLEASMIKGLDKTTKSYSNSKLPDRKSTPSPFRTTVGLEEDSFVETFGRSTQLTGYEASYDYSDSNLDQFNKYYDIERIKLRTTPGTPKDVSIVNGLEKTTKKSNFIQTTTTVASQYDDYAEYSDTNLDYKSIRLKTTPSSLLEASMVKGLEKTTKKPPRTSIASGLQYNFDVESQFNVFYDMDKIRLGTTPDTPQEIISAQSDSESSYQSKKPYDSTKWIKKPAKSKGHKPKRRTKKVFYCQSLPPKSAIKKSNTGLRLLKSVCESLSNEAV